MNIKIIESIYKVADDLSKLNKPEFINQLQKHKCGDIANIILNSKALKYILKKPRKQK